MVNIECSGCGKIISISTLSKGGTIRCECGILYTKQAMIDMKSLKENNIDTWDRIMANEPTGMSYQEGMERVTV